MRKPITLILILLVALPALCAVPVTGNLKDIATGAVTSGAYVRFELVNCMNPKQVGTSAIIKTSKDFKPDATGAITGMLVPVDEITCDNGASPAYQLKRFLGSQQVGTTVSYCITGAFDLNNPPGPCQIVPQSNTIALTGGITSDYVDVKLNELVHKTGDETIQGSKKFTFPGAFTNDAMHEGIKVEVNGLTAAGEFHGHLFKNDYATEGISAAIAVPADATNETSNAISGYVTNDAGQATSAIAITGMARSTSVDARVWGGVFVTTDGPAGLKSNSLYGTENDVNVNNADSVPHGLLVNGYWHAQPTDGAALEVQQPIGDVPGGAHWPHGLRFQRGATPPPDPNYAALYLEQQDSGNSQPSQGATLVSTSDAGVGNTGHFWLDPDGSFKFHLPTAGAYFKVDTGGFFQQNGGSSLPPSVLNNAVGVQGDVKHALGSGVDATYGVIGAAKATAEAEGDRAYGGWFKSSSTNTLTAQVAIHAEVVDASSSTTLIEGVAGGAQKFRVDGTGKITTSSNGLVTNLNADTVDGKHAPVAVRFGPTHAVGNVMCQTGATAGNTCDNTFNWPTAIGDANYTAVCTVSGVATGVPMVRVGTKSSTQLVVTVVAVTAAGAQASEISCVAQHD